MGGQHYVIPGLIAIGMPLVVHYGLHSRMLRWLTATGRVRSNYDSKLIPTSGGLILLVSSACSCLLLLLWGLVADRSGMSLDIGMLFLCGSSLMAMWGYVDDRAADQAIKGFRGHAATLWREGRMSSGVLKAWGGGSTALLVSLGVSSSVWGALLDALLLALSANLLNLFDLRPGRAIKVFWLYLLLVYLASLVFAGGEGLIWSVPVAAASLLFFPGDAAGRVMLGDTGANFLGFCVGFFCLLTFPLAVKCLLAALLLYLHVMAERCSFTRLIASVGWLDKLDRLGRYSSSSGSRFINRG